MKNSNRTPVKFDTSTVDRMARVTLNGGFNKASDPEDDRLVAEFLENNSVTVCPPTGVPGSEVCRATHEMISLRRREFRKSSRK